MAQTSSNSIFEKIYAHSDQIAALPEDVRAKVIDRLFSKTLEPRIPKAMNEEQRGLIRKNFENHILGRSPEKDTSGPTDQDFKTAGLPRGMGGKVQEGVMRGVGNTTSLLDKITNQMHEAFSQVPGGGTSNQSLSDLITGNKHGDDQSAMTKAFLESAGALGQSTAGYSARHPIKAGAAELGGQLLPAALTELVMPGAPPGAGMIPKIMSSAGKGAAGMVPFDPTTQGIASGAAFGAGMPILGKGFNKIKEALIKPGTKVAAQSTGAVAGAAENASVKLEEFAQKSFQKPLKDLTPEQKIEIVNKWRDASVDAAKTEKEVAKKSAATAREQAIAKNATEKIDKQVAVRRAMDEAKALQKQIREFVKTNKRAPTDEELTVLRKATPTPEVVKPVIEPAKAAAAKIEERGIKVPEKRTFLRSTKKDIQEYYSYRFDQLRKEGKAATTEAEKQDVQRRMNELVETQKAHPESMGDAQEFKVESPEAVKAVQAVADVSKAVDVLKVPEGEHGKGLIGQRAKDAERVAKARELARATQPEPAAAETPETALQKKEEDYFKLSEQIEAMGSKGKEAAKNLDVFRRKGKVTMDEAIDMGNKILEVLQKTNGAVTK